MRAALFILDKTSVYIGQSADGAESRQISIPSLFLTFCFFGLVFGMAKHLSKKDVRTSERARQINSNGGGNRATPSRERVRSRNGYPTYCQVDVSDHPPFSVDVELPPRTGFRPQPFDPTRRRGPLAVAFSEIADADADADAVIPLAVAADDHDSEIPLAFATAVDA